MFIISFPRSGQHLTESILKKLLDAHNLQFSYCEYYKCCNTIPCLYNKLFQKNHDFLGTYVINTNNKYIVLYRSDPILQLEAYYRYSLKKTKKNYCKEDLLLFYKSQINYYNNFKKKWIDSQKKNILVIEYYDLCNNTFFNVTKILNHFYPNFVFNDEIVKKILSDDFCVYDGCSKKVKNKIKIEYKINEDVYAYIKNNINNE